MSGATTTPHHRGDLGLGGAARVPLGALKGTAMNPRGDYVQSAQAGGVVPMAYGRYGIAEHWDLGLLVAGTTAQATIRGEKQLSNGTTRSALIYGIAPYGSWVADAVSSASGFRVGGEIPLTYGIDINSVYELWFGARVSGEYIRGDFEIEASNEDSSGFGLRVGPVIGMAMGVSAIHVLVELTTGYERWFISRGSGSFDIGGFVLIPGFGVRLRL